MAETWESKFEKLIEEKLEKMMESRIEKLVESRVYALMEAKLEKLVESKLEKHGSAEDTKVANGLSILDKLPEKLLSNIIDFTPESVFNLRLVIIICNISTRVSFIRNWLFSLPNE